MLSQTALARTPSARSAAAAPSLRAASLHAASKPADAEQLPYSDTVPASDKEELMDLVYCRVADKYDRTINVLSLFMNGMWKRRFVQRIQAAPGARLMDMAGGTGEIARQYLEYQKAQGDTTAHVDVVDFNPDMLRVGRRRLQGTEFASRVSFVEGNAEHLTDVKDASVDVYSIAAGMHNLPNPTKALEEAFRVLRPGGTFACLEYGHVDAPVIGGLAKWYMEHGVPAVGKFMTGDRAAYERLSASVRSFPHQKRFAQAIRDAGFEQQGQGYEEFQWGMMVSYIATKPQEAQ
ncbi:hypothetical protein LPJ53_003381 [Coemansia erecta]|uniref:2-methoxy-6-polyprenyl-1,4-benzoquinol methylase, mitochondrial n=1 Tax=Coemansia erecta TaxID=147472 RepID=A0A9W7Y0U1_9FUNG|nr:hypothetical protein LPJ53_003381 [Coemansia erecta]